MNDKKRCQVAFDVDVNFRQELKIMAARRNISMNLLIQRALLDYIKKEKKYDSESNMQTMQEGI